MDPITAWKLEAQEAFREYKKRDCGSKVYKGDRICRRAECAIINAYLEFETNVLDIIIQNKN